MNNRLIAAALSLLSLAACSKEVNQAQKELDMVKRDSHDLHAVCTAERKLTEAYLHDGDKRYGAQNVSADIACRKADQSDDMGV